MGPLGSPSKVDINTQASYRQCPTGRLFQYWVESGRVYIETNRGLRSGWVVLCSCDRISLGKGTNRPPPTPSAENNFAKKTLAEIDHIINMCQKDT